MLAVSSASASGLCVGIKPKVDNMTKSQNLLSSRVARDVYLAPKRGTMCWYVGQHDVTAGGCQHGNSSTGQV
jgi:hypothetical protein